MKNNGFASILFLQQIYFAETLAKDETVVLLEAGPFKLEASCRSTDFDWYSTYTSGSYNYEWTEHYVSDTV